MSHPARLTAEADDSHKGARLDRFLAGRFPEMSRTRLQNLIKQGRVALGAETISDVKYPVKPGDRFEIDVPPPAAATPEAQALPLDVVYEDDEIIVINKPAGLVVHPGAGNPDRTLVNALIAHCGESLSGIGGVKRPGIVHRLDRDTTGLLVVAKSERAHRRLQAMLRDRLVDRRYLALVHGEPDPAMTIDRPIGRHPRDRTRMAVVRDGRPSVTHVYVVERFTGMALCEVRLDTGRTHQIRVHLEAVGHPVVGDPVYGRRPRTLGLERQFLHAHRLAFPHPVADGEEVAVESPLPPDLADALERARRDHPAGRPPR